MDNKKIGKLIANLRKQKGLTQQELGDKVGVGFRAVSKWERGITLPDISIINEVSKILGISSDELLNGQIKTKNNNKISKKLKLTLLIITSLILITTVTIISYTNKTYTYTLESISEDYYVEGQVIIKHKDINIIINKLNIKDQKLKEIEIKNYEYHIYNRNKMLFGYGNTDITKMAEKIDTIKQFADNFRVNYKSSTFKERKELLRNNLIIKLKFESKTGELITKEIILKLNKITDLN